MAFRIKRNRDVESEVKRIAAEQCEKALAELSNADLNVHEQVHQVRKRCKKIRALLRLVRPALGKTYQRENAHYRDAAADLSYVRDAQSVLDTFDKLARHYPGSLTDSDLAAVRAVLVVRRDRLAQDETGIATRLAECRQRIQAGRARIDQWALDATGFALIAGGLKKTYARGRRAMSRAYASYDTDDFHEWRKRVKDYWYHTRLLRAEWPAVFKPQSRELKRLSEFLGDDHDLAVLGQTLDDAQTGPGDLKAGDKLNELIAARRTELQTQARPLGERFYCERPSASLERYACYWRVWHEHPPD